LALDEQSVALRAMEMLGLDETALPRLVTLIPAAKRRLALNVNGSARRNALRKSFALTVSSGAASLSSHLAAAEPLLLETVKAADIRSASSVYNWQWKGNRSVLALNPTGTDFFGYTLEGTNIYTDSTDASGTMFAGYEPSLATVETLGLDDELVELVAAMAVPGKEAAA
jgi:hypothetical protein